MTADSFDYTDPAWLAEKLGLDPEAVMKHLEEGSLPGLKLGEKWLVSPRKVAEFLDREAERQTAARRKPAEKRRFLITREDASDGKERFQLRQVEGDEGGADAKAGGRKRVLITSDAPAAPHQVRFALNRIDL